MYPSLSSRLHLTACEKKKQIYGMAGQLGKELCRLIPSSDSDGGSDRRCIAELVRVELCSVLHGSEVLCTAVQCNPLSDSTIQGNSSHGCVV